MEKSKIITEMTDRIDSIEEHLKKLVKAPAKKKGKKEEVDEEVCPECGGDLLFVEEGIVYCNKCSEYYEIADEGKD
jgi:uncharacterized protein with PIN domain